MSHALFTFGVCVLVHVEGPVNGPEAQMLVAVSHLAFAIFFYLCDRDNYAVQTIVQVFCVRTETRRDVQARAHASARSRRMLHVHICVRCDVM